MEIKGRCVQVGQVVTGVKKNGSGEWKKQDFVIETEGQYSKKICFQLFGDKIDKFPPAVGDVLTVSFELESREHNGRWFTQANAWKMEGFTGNLRGSSSQAPVSTPSSDPSDDLPF